MTNADWAWRESDRTTPCAWSSSSRIPGANGTPSTEGHNQWQSNLCTAPTLSGLQTMYKSSKCQQSLTILQRGCGKRQTSSLLPVEKGSLTTPLNKVHQRTKDHPPHGSGLDITQWPFSHSDSAQSIPRSCSNHNAVLSHC